MELFQLRSLLAVEKEGSITRAAALLNLTQPAVTQQLQALERELGVKLVERSGRGMHLTEAGTALADSARRAVALLDEARQAVADLAAGAAGRLVLGAGVTTSIFHLPRWLEAFRRRHPMVEVVVRTGHSREVVSMVLDREVDLGLVTSPVNRADLRVVPLHREEIVLVAPPGYPLARHRVQRDDLAEASLILFTKGSGFREYLDRALADVGVMPHVKMETDSVEAIKSFVAAGLGVSFLPAFAVRAELKDGTLKRLRTEGLPLLARETSAIYRVDRYLTAAARGFLRVLAG